MNRTIPFLKWPGGKRWLISDIDNLIKSFKCNQYFEPFLGGGAVFFSFEFEKAYLSDSNPQLINAYKTVQKFPKELISRVQKIPTDKATYYKIRSEEPVCEIDMAVRFLYLNRVAFGGMYRVNKEGKFNVPYGGRSTNILWKNKLIEKASLKLQNVDIYCQDFENTFERANAGDLIYCDPPYTVAHNLNGFQRYNENIFTWEDQIRLKDSCIKAAKRGVKIILSNAAHKSITELYNPLEPLVVNRYSGLSTIPSKRKKIDEFLLLFNF
ncbi:DNA adenine methylase [Labilibaculum euxinus]|uniref:Site-specific DNA-methyltransferase (adenine-specific) n=1 Tax=Labilibaculum euxinus TaxID=2686357 RepID=A0A7M4D2X7_9BACT|nr:Dam family site-specific DNA-(adenine-N6)-methyltransferase [Labilibaculum euxinus]MUP37006.1 Dam family site-specific DNA-(adenine-N6)-methyltransferase [Labilibaculum euxinus]MVB06211.1 Dam family site-specific DNA-(adenine-N6)-methyltransferase [Labilibaculum euxinus]